MPQYQYLKQIQVTGTGTINFNADNRFAPQIIGGTGTSKVNINNAGTDVILTAANTYSGVTTVNSGATLNSGTSGSLSPNSDFIVQSGGALNSANTDTIKSLNNAGITDILAGSTLTVSGDTTNSGTVNVNNATLTATGQVTNSGNLNLTGSTLNANNISNSGTVDITNSTLAPTVAVVNSGTVAFSGNQTIASLDNTGTVFWKDQSNTALTVTGNYKSTNGILDMNTYLGDDSSTTNKMVVNGTATGNTIIKVKSMPGSPGALTVNGINLVKLDNASSAKFELAGPVQAGLYQYQLKSVGNGWNLQSALITPAVPPTPTTPGTPSTVTPIYRPGVSNYVSAQYSNLDQGFQALGTLHERMGEQRYVVGDKDSWSRYYGRFSNFKGDNRFSQRSMVNGVQLGQDVYAKVKEDSQKHFGFFLDYANTQSSYQDRLNPINTDTGDMLSHSYGIGAYYTVVKQNSSYIDLVALANRVHNRFTDVYGSKSTQNGYRIAVSAEGGTKLFEVAKVKFEGQAQLMYQFISYGSFNDSFSTIDGYDSHSLRGRVGLRVYRDFSSNWLPYGIVNYISDIATPSSITVDGNKLGEKYSRHAGEIGAGVQVKIGKTTHIYADGRYLTSFSGSRESTKVSAGIKTEW